MVKEEVKRYVSVGGVALVFLAFAYFINVGFTGFAVFEESTLVISPENNSNFTVEEVNFSVNISDPDDEGIQNVTLNVYDSADDLIWNETNSSGVVGVYDFSNTFSDGDYEWSVIVFNSSNVSYESEKRLFSISTEEPAPPLPENESISYGENWEGVSFDVDSFEVNSSQDNVWSINDTDNFNINETGFLNLSVNVSLVVGNYYIKVSINDTDDAKDSAIYNLNVTQAEPSLSISGPSYVYDNEEANVQGLGCPEQLKSNCTLYREGEEVDNPDNTILEEGSYTYNYNTTGNENYTSASSKSFTLVVEKEEDEGETENETEIKENETEEVTVQEEPQEVISMSSGNIEDMTMNPGSFEEISWVVENTGSSFLMGCEFSVAGDNSEWVSSEGGQSNIEPGKERTFDFMVNVSEDIEEGEYSSEVSVDCSSGDSVSESFNVIVEKKKIGFEIVDARKTRQEDTARVVYSLKELSGESQDVEIEFLLEDSNGTEIANKSENRSIEANETGEFSVDIAVLNGSLEDEINLIVSYNSEIYSSSVQERLTLGAPIGGFAIFEELGFYDTGTNAIIVLAGAFVLLIVIFFIARKIRRSYKNKKDKKDSRSEKSKDSSPKKEKKKGKKEEKGSEEDESEK